ncbi:hypothetical protein AAC387_Pa06g1695 [Persea americana]
MCSVFDASLLARHGDLSYDAANIIDEASLSKEAYHHAKLVLQDLKKSIREINEKTVMAEDDPKRKKKSASPAERYLPPKQAITKGRPKRLKSSKENAKKKDRLCRGCGKRGVAHDRRNCPGLDKRISSILSLGRASSLEIRLVLQVEGGGRVELNSTVFGSDKEGTGAWSVSRGVDTLAAIGVVAGFEGAIESGLWREAFGVGEI